MLHLSLSHWICPHKHPCGIILASYMTHSRPHPTCSPRWIMLWHHMPERLIMCECWSGLLDRYRRIETTKGMRRISLFSTQVFPLVFLTLHKLQQLFDFFRVQVHMSCIIDCCLIRYLVSRYLVVFRIVNLTTCLHVLYLIWLQHISVTVS